MQDFMKLYSGMVERCFLACAQDFTTKALTSNEVSVELRRSYLRWNFGCGECDVPAVTSLNPAKLRLCSTMVSAGELALSRPT